MGAVTAAAIGGAAMLGSAYMGSQEAKKGRQAAERMAAQGAAAFAGIDVPEIEKQKIQLENAGIVGEYRPEVEQALNLSPTEMENISIDEAIKRQQMDSLSGLGEIAEGGLTEGDKAAARDIQREVNQNAEARRKAILQNMAQRGVLGSGMELAAQLDSAQDAADQQSRASDALQQQAQARALAALQQSGAMAGQIRGQEFSEQADIAKAKDAINQWNVANQQSINSRNVQAQNQAQAANLAARQAQEDQRAALANQQQMYNKQLLQQQYQNELQRASGLAGQYQAQGQLAQQAGAAQAQMIGGIGSAIGNMAGTIGAAYAKQPATPTQTQNQGQLSTMNTATPQYYNDPNKMYS